MGQEAFRLALVCCVLLSGSGWCQTVPFVPQDAADGETLGLDILLFDDVGEPNQSLTKPIREMLDAQETFSFGLEVLEEDGTFPDVLLTLSVTNANGDADIYCSPWTIASQIRFPSPQLSTWKSDHTRGDDHVFISRTNDLYVQEKKLNVTVGKKEFKSARFICSVIGKEVGGTDVELEVDVLYPTRSLVREEIKALKEIHENCCGGTIPCPFGDGEPQNLIISVNTVKDGGEDALFDFCHAFGSFCDKDGRLVRLDMSGFGMTCDFPSAALGKMKRLRKLDMNSNSMKGDIGEIAERLSELKNLERVSLADNLLSGTLSEGMGSGICKLASKKLTFLNLNSNKVTGEVPECLFQADSVLEEVHVDLNNLNGTLPEFSPDAKVEILSVSNTNISGFIPESLGELDTLRAIRMSNNKLLGIIPESIASPPNLLILDLGTNGLVGGIPDSVTSAPILRILHLSENNLTSLPEAWVSGTSKSEALQQVDLSRNQIESEFPLGLAFLPDLVYLNVANNNFGGTLPPEENMFPSATVLILAYNKFEGQVPEEFGSIGMFAGKTDPRSLPVFSLSHNDLTGDIPEFFHDSQRPTSLTNRIFLGGNTLQCPEPEELHGVSDLVCFTKCNCTAEGEEGSKGNLLKGDAQEEQKKERGVDSLSTGAQAAIGVVGAILVVVLVVIVAFVISVMLKKRRWTTKLDDIATGEGDIEVGTRSANV